MGPAAALFLLVVVSLIAYHLWKHVQLKRIIDKIHGPEPYWIVGNILHIKLDPYEWFEQACGCAVLWSNPRMYRIWLLTTPYIVITGAAEAEPVLGNAKNTYKTFDYNLLRPWVRMGLFANEGDPWRRRRKMMTPAFHNDIVSHFVPVFRRQGKTLVTRLAERVGQGPFDIYRYVTVCALAVIWEAGMGTDLNLQQNADSKYVYAVHRMGDLLCLRQRSPWLWPKWIFEKTAVGKEQSELLSIIHNTVKEVIDKRWQEEYANGKDHNSNEPKTNRNQEDHTIAKFWLDQVQKGHLTLADVNDEANSLLFGGFDTTGTSLTWTLYFIGCHPEVQAKIHEELDTVLGSDYDREITGDDLKNMIYLECCLKEALRLCPPAPNIGRVLTEDTMIGGKLVPAGTSIMVDLYSIHHDPQYWPEPHRYIPERHLPENSTGRHPYAYVPFSAGIRNCIAQRYAMVNNKMILSTFFSRYSIKSMDRPDQLRARPDVILRPKRMIVELSLRRET